MLYVGFPGGVLGADSSEEACAVPSAAGVALEEKEREEKYPEVEDEEVEEVEEVEEAKYAKFFVPDSSPVQGVDSSPCYVWRVCS
jgi:hypothetical protein